MKISNKAIDNPLNSWFFIILIFIVGFISLNTLTLELFPEIEIPKIIITVDYPGASPDEIEFEINKKVEDQIKGINGIKKIVSRAYSNTGVTIVEFYSDVGLNYKKIEVKEEIDKLIDSFPLNNNKKLSPNVSSVDFSTFPFMNVVIYGKSLDYITLKDYASKLEDILLNVKGVSKVDISGGVDREIKIDIDPVAMWGYKVNLVDTINFFENGKDKSSGKIDIGEYEYPIKVISSFKNKSDILDLVLAYRDGKPLYLKELGDIRIDGGENNVLSRYNGMPAINLGIVKQSDTNLVDLSDRIENIILDIKNTSIFPQNVNIVIGEDQSIQVRERLDELTNNIIQGIIIVVLTLYLLLGFKNALIASVSIPFSIFFTMVGLLIFDETINNLTQFGLILIIGIVVDGAIVVLENINQYLEQGDSPKDASKKGVNEVGPAVLSAGLTTMSAFAPMLFMTGIVGQFMSVIPKTVIFAITGSLIFDHIVIPVLCSSVLRDSGDRNIKAPWERLFLLFLRNKTDFSYISQGLVDFYKKILNWALNNQSKTLYYSLFGFFLGIFLLVIRPKNFFPELDLGKFWINVELASGSVVEKTDFITRKIEDFILPFIKNDDNENGVIDYYISNVGSTGISTFSNVQNSTAKNIARIQVEMIDKDDRDVSVNEFTAGLRNNIIQNISGARINISTPQSGPPTGKPINIVVVGDDISVLKKISSQVIDIVSKVPGAIDVRDNYGPSKPEFRIKVNRNLAERYGFDMSYIHSVFNVLNKGYKLGDYRYYDSDYDIKLKVKKYYDNPIENFKMTAIYSHKFDKPIPITAFSDITLEGGLSKIYREDFKRSITISANIAKNTHTSAQVSQDVINNLSDFKAPKGYLLKFRGENEDRDESFEGLKLTFFISFIIIYFIVVIELKSFLQPFSILIAIPLSVLGIAIGLIIGDEKLGIMAFFGIVSLTGIVVNDSIVLLSQINLLRFNGMDLREAIVQSCVRRLRPILLTTFTTIGSLLPLALSIGSAPFFSAMGWSIIGGLFLSTIQIIVVLPVIYIKFESLRFRFFIYFKKKIK